MAPNVPDNQQLRPSLQQSQRLWSGLSALSKRSYRSFATSNFEADDERSSSSSGMSPPRSEDGSRPLPRPLFLGQDSRPTSPKELLGWYAYAFAAETYIICGIGMYSFLLDYLTYTLGLSRPRLGVPLSSTTRPYVLLPGLEADSPRQHRSSPSYLRA